MKLETALLRLIGEPEKVIRRLSWDASRPSIGIKANLSQVAPHWMTRDGIRSSIQRVRQVASPKLTSTFTTWQDKPVEWIVCKECQKKIRQGRLAPLLTTAIWQHEIARKDAN